MIAENAMTWLHDLGQLQNAGSPLKGLMAADFDALADAYDRSSEALAAIGSNQGLTTLAQLASDLTALLAKCFVSAHDPNHRMLPETYRVFVGSRSLINRAAQASCDLPRATIHAAVHRTVNQIAQIKYGELWRLGVSEDRDYFVPWLIPTILGPIILQQMQLLAYRAIGPNVDYTAEEDAAAKRECRDLVLSSELEVAIREDALTWLEHIGEVGDAAANEQGYREFLDTLQSNLRADVSEVTEAATNLLKFAQRVQLDETRSGSIASRILGLIPFAGPVLAGVTDDDLHQRLFRARVMEQKTLEIRNASLRLS
jgi:hypothetical protein